jgi:hypothetical protein
MRFVVPSPLAGEGQDEGCIKEIGDYLLDEVNYSC